LGGGTSQARTPKVRRLRLTPEAELDLDAAYAWYHAQSPRLAREFLAAVSTAIASIRRHPEAYQLVDPTMRRALRLSCTLCSMARGTHEAGVAADETHNYTLDRTAGSRSLAAAGQHAC
jgi:plasmid stabilization system protein ParE